MSRTRVALFAILLVGLAYLGYQRFERISEERAAEVARQTSATIFRERREREKREADLQPHGDKALDAIPKAYPRPASAWRAGEETRYGALLSKGRFDLLVVPFQVQDYAFDRTTRSLMTAELALAIGAAHKKVPDPYLVARALGDGARRLNPDRIVPLAGRLHVAKIVWGYVGYLREDMMRVTIQWQDLRDSGVPQSTAKARHFENVPFSEEDPPAEVFQRMLPEVLKTIELEAPPAGQEPVSRFETPVLPSSPLQMVSDRAEPARDAYQLQLLAALTPRGAERTRERLIEKSMLALLGMSPASPDYRVLKARALMRMGQRPAALKALGSPGTDEQRHLFALLNGNLPEVERYSAKIPSGLRAFIARIELNEIASAYQARTQKRSLKEAKKLKLVGPVWPFLAARAFTDWDTWSQFENARLKLLLEREFPVAGFTAEGIVRGAVTLGDVSKVQTALDLSVLNHARKVWETQAESWCCTPLTPRLTAPDYLDFLDGLGTDNLVRQAHLRAWMQGAPQSALEFLDRIDSAYRDQPQLTLERARAESQLGRESDGAQRDGRLKAAYEHAFNAYYWEQGQTRNALEAWWVLAGSDRRDYGNLTNWYASDRPPRSFYPVSDAPTDVIANESARLRNSSFDFDPVNRLRWLLGERRNDWGQFDQVLKSIENRFAGNPDRVLLLAKESARKGDFGSAQRYYRDDIRTQPGHWDSYMDLGRMLFEDGDEGKAAQLFMSYPGFAARSDENSVELSNHAFNAGSLFYWSGNFRQAMPLYRIAAELRTGSNASMSSEIRISLANGDYATALAGSLERANRYNTAFAYRDSFGMLHAMGRSKEAWEVFNSLVVQMKNPELWETPLVGHRIAGLTEAQIAEWVALDPVSKSGYAGMYLLRAGVTDRTPTPGLAKAIAAVERPVLKVEPQGPVVRVAADGRTQLLSFSDDSGVPELPLAVDPRKKVRVKSDLVYFAEAYLALQARDFARAEQILGEALGLYDMRIRDVGYLLPYYAFAATKRGDSVSVSARLDKFDAAHQRFDYYLSRAVVDGLAGKTADSLKNLRLALYRRPFTESRPVYTEYQFAEICEWLYDATRNPRYRDMAVSWAKSVQTFNPWFAWPYAVEARYSADGNERNRAIAMAYYLDRKSERLAKIPKAKIDAAVKGFAGRNPFLNPRRPREESST